MLPAPLTDRGAPLSDFGVGMAAALGGRPRRARIDALGRGLFPSAGATLDLDFLRNQGYVYGLGIGRISDLLTISGGAGGTCINSEGYIVAASAPRFDYDPLTLIARGVLIAEQRSNSIRNATMQGAVAGSPGTMPTFWNVGTPWDGLNRQVVGAGTENGIAYIDLRFSGTIAAGGVATSVSFDSQTSQSASSGQTWTESVYLRLVGGSFANIASLTLNIRDYDSTPTLVENLNGSNLTGSISGASLISQRFAYASALTAASIASVQGNLRMVTASAGQAVDFTLRIGLPKLTLGAVDDETPIPTTNAAVTRPADNITVSGSNFTTLDIANRGTLVFEGELSGALGSNRFLLSVNDGTVNNEISLYVSPSGSLVGMVTVGGVQQENIFGGVVAPNTVFKGALSFDSGFLQIALNGAVIKTGAPASLPVTNRLTVGRRGNDSFYLNGRARRARVFQPSMRDAALGALTK